MYYCNDSFNLFADTTFQRDHTFAVNLHYITKIKIYGLDTCLFLTHPGIMVSNMDVPSLLSIQYDVSYTESRVGTIRVFQLRNTLTLAVSRHCRNKEDDEMFVRELQNGSQNHKH